MRAVGLAVAALAIGLPSLLLYREHATAERATTLARAPAWQDFRTAVGQTLTVTLEDGSRVTLDTASRLRVAYTAQERRLQLDSGQAWFEVAKHQPRPFVVMAGDHRVEAHGTAFDVRIAPDRAEVLLAEGAVTVSSRRPGAGNATIAMRPNDLLEATPRGMIVRQVRDVSERAGWRHGVVTFNNVPLAQAAAEMNRYSSTRLVIADDRTGRIAVSGAFNTGSTKAFIEALSLAFGVHALPGPDGSIALSSGS